MSPLSRFTLRALLAMLAGAMLTGCGYTGKSLYPSDVRTVAVPMWKRGPHVYRRDLEIELTRALVNRIESATPYKVVDRTRADTELTGTIESIQQRVLSFNPDTGRPRELEMTFTVSFIWRDLRPGKGDIRVQETDFSVAAVRIPDEPIGQDFFLGRQELYDDLARRIVEKMEEDWPEP